MANIYTRTGDKGITGLYGGSRISKDDLRVYCYGTIDEANSVIGAAYAFLEDEELKKLLRRIQEKMFVLGAELASDIKGIDMLSEKISKSDIEFLESNIDYLTEETGKMKKFLIPGGTKASSFIHVARTVVRRAERNIIGLSRNEDIREEVIGYTNRLSDALYAIARAEERRSLIKKIREIVIRKVKSQSRDGDEQRIFPLSLNLCRKMVRAAVAKAEEIGVPIVFAVVDEHGNLVLFERMEGSLLASIDISINKAYSSSALKMSTDKISQLVKPDSELYGIQWTNRGRIVSFGGGYTLRYHGKVIGGIGVSGGTVKEDMIIASHSLKVFEMEK